MISLIFIQILSKLKLKNVEQQYMVGKYPFNRLVELQARDEGFHQEKK